MNFRRMCTLPHEISSSFKKVMTDMLTGFVPNTSTKYTTQYNIIFVT